MDGTATKAEENALKTITSGIEKQKEKGCRT